MSVWVRDEATGSGEMDRPSVSQRQTEGSRGGGGAEAGLEDATQVLDLTSEEVGGDFHRRWK